MKNIEIFNNFTSELQNNGYCGVTTVSDGRLAFLYCKSEETNPNNIYFLHHSHLMYDDALLSLKRLRQEILENQDTFLNSLSGTSKDFCVKEGKFVISIIDGLI